MNDSPIAINRGGSFTIDEARQVLPIIKKITAEYCQVVDQQIARLESLDVKQTDLICNLEDQAHELVCQWHEKVRKLGGVPKGLWLVDFDSGNGYFCWKYPEPDILYWHAYTDGFSGRIPVDERPMVSKKQKEFVDVQSQQSY